MKFKKVLLILSVVLSMTQVFTALGQSSGTWIIPPGAPSYITSGYLDSLNLIPTDPMNPPGIHVGPDSIGKLMFSTHLYLQKNLTKEQATRYLCGEKYWVKLTAQRDTIDNILEYSIATTSLDSTGNEFWTEPIIVNVVDTTEIIINSPVDLIAKLYEAYVPGNQISEQLTVTGSGINQSYSVNMKNGNEYIIVFVKNENFIVFAKRIGG